MSTGNLPREVPIPTGARRSWMPYDSHPDLIWEYTHLNEPHLTTKLEELSKWGSLTDTDYATLQPSLNPDEASQDRHVIEDWDIAGGKWKFRAVFDGHGGHDTVDYTAANLPLQLFGNLRALVTENSRYNASDISQLLVQTIVDFDSSLGTALLDLFPGDSIYEYTDEQIEQVIQDPANVPTILRCIRGTTVLISLVDPDNANLWVASLGDCTAILGKKDPISGTWSTQTLSHNHNGGNRAEQDKVFLEHHGEEQCIQNNRVLGAIAVTRAIGDFVFKLPSIFTERVLLHCETGFRLSEKVKQILPRVLTPPYVSNIPQVTHTRLPRSRSTYNVTPNHFNSLQPQQMNGTAQYSNQGAESLPSTVLVMFSDGLGDLYEDEFYDSSTAPGFWSYILGQVMRGDRKDRNAALGFIRVGLGGEDPTRVSRLLTTEYEGRWMDDTTVIVQRL